MTSGSNQQPGHLSSGKTEKFEAPNKIIALGRMIVDEFKMEPSTDTLGKWMAHYIAELIDKVENETGAKRKDAEKRCFETILNLWQHRSEFPNGKRPFQEMEPIVRALESLDPENARSRYFRVTDDETRGDSKETLKWLEVAHGLDYTARVLIEHCLVLAAGEALDKTKSWVKTAEAAGVEDGVLEITIKYLSEADLSDEEISISEDDVAKAKKELEDSLKKRLGRLEAFIALSNVLVADLKTKLGNTGSDSQKS